MSIRPPRWLSSLVMCAALAVLGGSWALASHPASSPDDGFHLASIWCAWGRDATGCEAGPPSGGGRWVRVPDLAEVISQCPNRQPDLSAACNAQDSGSAAEFPNYANASSYPPGYYAVARLFVGPDPVKSMLVLRVLAFGVSAGLVIAGGLLLAGQDRWRTWWHITAMSVPLGLFIAASNNPSGPMIAGCVAVAAGAYTIGQQRSRRHMAAALALALVGVLVASQTRPDGWQFASVCLGLAALASLPSLRALLQPSRILPWVAIFASLVVVWWSSRRPASLGFSPSDGGDQADRTSQFANLLAIPGYSSEGADAPWAQFPSSVWANLLEIPRFYIGEFATNLGSFDTPMPAITWGLVALVLGGIVALGVSDLNRYRAAALVLAAAALTLVPLYMLQSLGAPVGYWVQPRYLLPLVLTAGLLLAVRPGTVTAVQRGQVVVLAIMLATAHTWALHRRIRRSVTGLDGDGLDLSTGAEWWWPIPISPNQLWLIGSVAFVVLIAGLSWAWLKSGPAVSGSSGSVRKEAPGARTDSGAEPGQ